MLDGRYKMTKILNRKKEISLPMSSFHLEADKYGKNTHIIVSGIVGIKDFSDTYVLLTSHGGKIQFEGKKLVINVLENKNIQVSGKIEVINFNYGKN